MPLDDDMLRTLTGAFNKELEQLKELEAQRERDRKAKADNTEQLLRTMLEMQATAEKRADERRKFLIRFILGPSGLIAAISGAVLGYTQATRTDEDPPGLEDTKRVRATTTKVEQRVNQLDTRLKINDLKVERVVDVLLDQQVQLSDSIDHVIEKIERAHPQTRSIQEPPSLTEGREKARAIKVKQAPEYDPADPLGDLD